MKTKQQLTYVILLEHYTCKTSAAVLTRSLFHSFNMRTVKWKVFGLIKIDFSIPKSACKEGSDQFKKKKRKDKTVLTRYVLRELESKTI